MARTKQRTPLKRDASNDWIDHREVDMPHVNGNAKGSLSNGHVKAPPALPDADRTLSEQVAKSQDAGIAELVICVGGIYASFLSWALLQERITTTSYGPPAAPQVFTHSIVLNTVQSAFAALVGYAYLLFSSRNKPSVPSIFPSRGIVGPLAMVSIMSSLASPFGYASLKHVGYITFILAKSCKLLPVMALHVSVFRRRYPLYKYAVVALVTAGVAIFTLQNPSSKKKRGPGQDASQGFGIFLLSVNLLFDGLTNSTQDYINGAFAPYSGSQMMCAQNLISTALSTMYLFVWPWLSTATPLASILGLPAASEPGGELQSAIAFITRYPSVGYDILGFAACGAIGQVFIFYTLAKFSSLLLVTITVTRKMLTMLLSVVWFGHSLGVGQWVGVGLVFGGVGAEAVIGRMEKAKKERKKGTVQKAAGKEL